MTPDLPPTRIKVDDLPSDVASAVGKPSIAACAPSRRLQGSEGQKVRLHQYARQIDRALQSLLHGLDVPLILAARQSRSPASTDRSTRTPTCSSRVCPGIRMPPPTPNSPPVPATCSTTSPRNSCVPSMSSTPCGSRRGARSSMSRRSLARRPSAPSIRCWWTSTDVPGEVDDHSGAVAFGTATAGGVHDVADEIARRAWSSGARVLAVRANEIPGQGPVAAVLRYTL